jgi:signal peptidase
MKVIEGKPQYITKGDANNAPDQKVVLKKEILGKVLLDIPYLGYAVDFIKKPLGFALIILIPAGIIISDEIKKIFKEIKKNKIENQ